MCKLPRVSYALNRQLLADHLIVGHRVIELMLLHGLFIQELTGGHLRLLLYGLLGILRQMGLVAPLSRSDGLLESLLLHLLNAIAEFVDENLHLACLPEVGSEALQIYLHICDFLCHGKILVKIEQPQHRAQALLKFIGFIFQR